jgi:hypothetical protein
MPTLSRPILAAMIASLLLAGCAQHENARSTRPAATTTSTTSTTPRARAAPAPARSETAPGEATQASQPDKTGIPVCDDYLSSYLACHRAAAIYAPSQLQSRYEAMRTSLLRDSKNPDIRPQLGARCNSLASQLREALHGKSCAATP